MDYREIGQTGIRVSRLCFGSLTLGPLQKNLGLSEGIGLIEEAIDYGVNFIDTADLYDTYDYIKGALKKAPDMIVSSKSYAYDNKTAEETLNRALKAIDRDYIDFFLLHEQEGPLTLKGHWEAIEYLIRAKEEGKVRAIGISTHHIEGVKAASSLAEMDIIHPIINYKGFGIVDGSLSEMEKAIEEAHKRGKGIYAMKALGGGHLIRDMNLAMDYILSLPYLDSIAIGMQRSEEIGVNVKLFNGISPSKAELDSLKSHDRELFIHDWCVGCGICIEKCQQKALYMNSKGKADVDRDSCVLCGYCGAYCMELAIKII